MFGTLRHCFLFSLLVLVVTNRHCLKSSAFPTTADFPTVQEPDAPPPAVVAAIVRGRFNLNESWAVSSHPQDVAVTSVTLLSPYAMPEVLYLDDETLPSLEPSTFAEMTSVGTFAAETSNNVTAVGNIVVKSVDYKSLILKGTVQLSAMALLTLVALACALTKVDLLISTKSITPIARMIKLIKKLAGTVFAVVSS